ncbi:NAD-dependent epimerase/dehydratase family protein [Flavobacterium sp.]|uniref:NAD-dependent epimerase/dehydratase family protein n=1 Tax=Flavobacterium sp. TaxID=239 RepID=UPI0033402A15
MSLIVLTGTTGYIGQNLTTYFNSISKKNKSISLRFQNWHEMMPLETETIIHLAAINLNLRDSSFDEEYFRVNTELTTKLFRFFLHSNAKTFIYLSTIELIDKQILEVSENAKVNPTNPFLQSKFDAEQFILKQELPEGKRAIILRVATVYGRETKSSLHDTFRFCKKFPWFFGIFDSKQSFCYIDNLTAIIAQISEKKAVPSGIYNVSDNEPIVTTELIKWIADVFDKKAKIIKVPKGILTLFAKTGDLFKWEYNSTKLLEISQSRTINGNKVKEALEITKMPFDTETSVLKTIEYYNSIKI